MLRLEVVLDAKRSDEGQLLSINAVAESFFALMKTESIYPRRFATRRAAKDANFDYVEVFYTRRRRHSTLGHHSPVDLNLSLLKKHLHSDTLMAPAKRCQLV